MRRRTKRALVAGACALALYLLHLVWFMLFGPPDWFEAVRERAPQITSVALGSAFDPYLEELDRPRQASLGQGASASLAGISGRVVREDRLPGVAALRQTRDERQDRLYVSAPAGEPWREQPLPAFDRLEEARLFRAEGGLSVLMVGLRPWSPHERSYGRFWRALFSPELRPEAGLYESVPRSGEPSYLFPGRRPVLSPDRKNVAFLRSDRRGFHSIHLWSPAADGVRTVASLWEADPGSGVSFHVSWSADSRVLFVRGLARGSMGRPEAQVREVRLLYDVAGDRLVEIRP